MKRIAFGIITAIVSMTLLWCAGCAGYGHTRYQGLVQGREMIDVMLNNFDDYHVYYSGMSPDFPSGVIFDPVGDETTVAQKEWIAVETRELAKELVQNLERYPHHLKPRLYALIGEDGLHYGYIYTSYTNIVVRQLDEGKIYVYEMPEAPHLRYEAGGF